MCRAYWNILLECIKKSMDNFLCLICNVDDYMDGSGIKIKRGPIHIAAPP